jgi:hypothetical protein
MHESPSNDQFPREHGYSLLCLQFWGDVIDQWKIIVEGDEMSSVPLCSLIFYQHFQLTRRPDDIGRRI